MNPPAVQNHSFTSPLRYPGGKGALSRFMQLVAANNHVLDGHYAEVFAGGAGIAWSLLFGEYVRHVHINDIDEAIFSLWISVIHSTDDLCKFIRDTKVTVAEWHKQKQVQENRDNCTPLELACSTFFLNRTNRSGIIGGGIIGGKSQKGKWKLGARFNRQDLIRRVKRIARYRNRISVYCQDGRDFVKDVVAGLPEQSLVYFDPPYYAKSRELYRNSLSHSDHKSLASLIQKNVCQPWIVSYDATPEVTAMYKQRRSLRYSLSYSAQSRYSGSEIMFFGDSVKIPDVEHPIVSRKCQRLLFESL